MPLPPRFDPRWLVIPAIALMIALGYPRQVPVDGPFRAGLPATLSASPPPVVSSPGTRSPSPARPAGTTAPTPQPQPAAPQQAEPVPATTRRPAEPVPAATGRPAEPSAPAAPQPTRRVPAAATRDGWSWPLPEPITVARPFQAPEHPYGPGHRGVDLRSAPGSQVRAARSGVVGFAGRVADRWVVTVVHGETTPGGHPSAPAAPQVRSVPVPDDAAPDDLEPGGPEPDQLARPGMPPGAPRTTYEPVRPLVRTGQPVSVGEPIGVLDAGHRGCPGPACLHWGLIDAAGYLDPLTLFRRVPPRLLPLDG